MAQLEIQAFALGGGGEVFKRIHKQKASELIACGYDLVFNFQKRVRFRTEYFNVSGYRRFRFW